MNLDYLDALRYGVEFETRYMGKWNIKEENNMNIPGQLREHLKRIYGANDPLNYIEDLVIKETPCDTQIDVTLRIPRGCLKYAEYVGELMSPPSSLTHVLEDAFGLVSPGVPKAPECKGRKVYIGQKAPIKWTMPDRVVYSGPKTLVFWPDGSKTMVSLREGEEYDEYAAFCAAVVKKMFGATHKAKKFLDSIKVIQKKKKKQAEPELVPMPGTTQPDWGECVVAEEES